MESIRSPLLEMDLRPHVVEAIGHFGFIRIESADWLTAEIMKAHTRNNGRTIRENGTRVSPDEGVGIGLNQWEGGQLSREVLDSLTEVGRAGPVINFDATCSRAVKRAQGVAQIERHKRVRKVFPAVIFSTCAAALQPCTASAALHGTISTDPLLFPLPDCDALFCPCAWRSLTQWEIAVHRR